jgi:hypothetical protein
MSTTLDAVTMYPFRRDAYAKRAGADRFLALGCGSRPRIELYVSYVPTSHAPESVRDPTYGSNRRMTRPLGYWGSGTGGGGSMRLTGAGGVGPGRDGTGGGMRTTGPGAVWGRAARIMLPRTTNPKAITDSVKNARYWASTSVRPRAPPARGRSASSSAVESHAGGGGRAGPGPRFWAIAPPVAFARVSGRAASRTSRPSVDAPLGPLARRHGTRYRRCVLPAAGAGRSLGVVGSSRRAPTMYRELRSSGPEGGRLGRAATEPACRYRARAR